MGEDLRHAEFFFLKAEAGIRDLTVTGVQTCALPIFEKNYSEETGRLIDSEMKRFMKNAFSRALGILRKYRKVLNALAGRLIENETIEREEFEAILSSFGLKQILLAPVAQR